MLLHSARLNQWAVFELCSTRMTANTNQLTHHRCIAGWCVVRQPVRCSHSSCSTYIIHIVYKFTQANLLGRIDLETAIHCPSSSHHISYHQGSADRLFAKQCVLNGTHIYPKSTLEINATPEIDEARPAAPSWTEKPCSWNKYGISGE